MPDASKTTSSIDRILDAAVSCYSQLGADKTSMEDIVRQSGLSRATVYRYVRNKQDLLLKVMERISLNVVDQLKRNLEHESNLSDALIDCIVFVATDLELIQLSTLWFADRDNSALLVPRPPYQLIKDFAMELLEPVYVRAKAKSDVAPNLTLEDICDWGTRIMMSLIVDENRSQLKKRQLRKQLELLLVPAIEKGI